jgi:hypothetical protein
MIKSDSIFLDGQMSKNFGVGVQIRGILESEGEGELIYNGEIHNRTRLLNCGQV